MWMKIDSTGYGNRMLGLGVVSLSDNFIRKIVSNSCQM